MLAGFGPNRCSNFHRSDVIDAGAYQGHTCESRQRAIDRRHADDRYRQYVGAVRAGACRRARGDPGTKRPGDDRDDLPRRGRIEPGRLGGNRLWEGPDDAPSSLER